MSLLTKLKNKVVYKINETVDDPKANQFAEEEKKKQDEEAKKKNTPKIKSKTQIVQDFLDKSGNRKKVDETIMPLFQNELKNKVEELRKQNKSEQEINKLAGEWLQDTSKKIEEKMADLINNNKDIDEITSSIKDTFFLFGQGDPNKFDKDRLFKKIWYYVEYAATTILPIILAFFFSSLIANEMLIYPSQIRFAFFIIVFIGCLLFRPLLFVFALYYGAIYLMDYYVNYLSDGPKRRIFPKIYSFLPLTTNQPDNTIKAFFFSPFIYGLVKSKKDDEELKEIMKTYKKTLDESFPYLEKIKNQEPFEKPYESIQKQLDTLHTSNYKYPNNNEENTNQEKNKEENTNQEKNKEENKNQEKNKEENKNQEANEEENRNQEEENKKSKTLNERVEEAVRKRTEETKIPITLAERKNIREAIEKEMKEETNKKEKKEKENKRQKELNKRVDEAIQKKIEQNKLPPTLSEKQKIRENIEKQMKINEENVITNKNSSNLASTQSVSAISNSEEESKPVVSNPEESSNLKEEPKLKEEVSNSKIATSEEPILPSVINQTQAQTAPLPGVIDQPQEVPLPGVIGQPPVQPSVQPQKESLPSVIGQPPK